VRILLAGATGAIGRRLLPMLIAEGHEVVGIARSQQRAEQLRAAGAEAEIADALDAPALRAAVARVGLEPAGESARFAPAPPWGELAMTPREAYLGAQEVVPAAQAVGRIAAESLATYPPGIPNVLPGERLTAETLAYVQNTLELGGSVRGASDRLLRTVRVVAAR